MNVNTIKGNRKSLSSGVTKRIKFIVIPLVGGIVLMLYISFITSIQDEPEIMAYGSLVALAILFVLFMMTKRIYFVEYDDQFVYVKNYGKEKAFPLHTVQSVNLPYYSRTRDRTYQVVIEQPGGRIREFKFLPIEPDHSIWGRPQDPESIKEFKEMVRQVKENVRS